MTLILELTPEQEQQIEAEARARNMDTRSYALTRLLEMDYGTNAGSEEQETLPEPGSLTPAQTIAYWETRAFCGLARTCLTAQFMRVSFGKKRKHGSGNKHYACHSPFGRRRRDCIQYKHPPALAWFSSLTANLSVPRIAVIELYQGARSKREEREVEVLLVPLPTVWPTEVNCQRALAEFRKFHLSHGLGLLDALITATAIGFGATLCTFNAKHYKNIAGLVLEQAYAG